MTQEEINEREKQADLEIAAEIWGLFLKFSDLRRDFERFNSGFLNAPHHEYKDWNARQIISKLDEIGQLFISGFRG